MTPQDIMDAWVHLRKNDSTIPDNVLNFMRDCAIKKLTGEWTKASRLLPTVEKHGKKVLVYRIVNDGQKDMAKSIHDTNMVKHCNPDETWWQPLPDDPEH